MHKQTLNLIQSLSEHEGVEVAQALYCACRFTARYWGDILRLYLSSPKEQNLGQYLIVKTNPLNPKLINRFQQMLELLIFEEISKLGIHPDIEETLDFDRWVGCMEYGPNTYLAEVVEALSISVLYFPPRMGWYVSPGKVISLSGEIRKFHFTKESLN
jgi:hypothetical protein